MQRPPELDQLLARLKAARRKFSDDQRQGASAALDALCDYVRVVSDDIGIEAPLIALMAALGDLDRGITAEIVRREPYKDGPQKPTYAALDWASVVAALTLANEARMPKALEVVARAAGVGKKVLGEMQRNITNRGTAPANTILNYEYFLAKARSFKDMTPKDRAARALQHVRDMTNIR
jgi:hypothetical protein